MNRNNQMSISLGDTVRKVAADMREIAVKVAMNEFLSRFHLSGVA